MVGKNYRLQDIQLSKNRLKLAAAGSQPSALGASAFAPAGYGVTSFSPDLVARFTPARRLPARSVLLAGTVDCYIAVTEVQADAAIFVIAPTPRLRASSSQAVQGHSLTSRSLTPSGFSRPDSCGRRLVENTGLEPVTSWLQTRRSPS